MRIGSKKNQPRPLKVTLIDENDQKTVRKAAHMLKDTTYNNIAIAPDMSQEERAERRALVKELRERKEKGETNLVIRKGEIRALPTHRDNEEETQDTTGSEQGDGTI